MADILYAGSGGDTATDDNPNEFYCQTNYGNNTAPSGMYNSQVQQRPRYPGLYVGNLTWWTTDRDVIDAINSIGVDDVQEVKFFENRNNGQSKGYCVVTFSSDASLPIVIEKLPTKELHGQNPMVTPYNRQNLNIFENQNKPRPPMNSTNGPTSHGAGIMGINSITGVHAAAAAAAAAATAQVGAPAAVTNLPYPGVAPPVGVPGGVGLGYNQTAALGMNSLGGAGGPRPFHHSNVRMPMRGPRPMIRGSMMGGMNNGPMMPGGHQMNRMRFMSQQNWNNNQGGYNPAVNRVGPQMNTDISNRLGVSSGGSLSKQDESGSDMMGSSSYYNSHHSNTQSDHYRGDMRDHRDHRDSRDDRDVRRLDDRTRMEDRSMRHDDRMRDDRPTNRDDRSERVRRDDRSSRRIEDDRSSRRSDERRDRDDRSSRREEKSSSSSSRHHRERSHRSDERTRSRSRSKDRSKDGKERKERDRDRDRDRRERY